MYPLRPYFEAEAAAGNARRLILLGMHFPPSQTAGALRWEKMVTVAYEHGFNVDAIALAPDQLASSDLHSLASLPSGTRVWGAEMPTLLVQRVEALLRRLAREWAPVAKSGSRSRMTSPAPASFAAGEIPSFPRSVREWLRTYDALVDLAREGIWARRAAAIGLQIFDPDRHVGIVSCGPPHMVHMGGRRLARATGLPWFIDMRDPWSLAERLPEPIASAAWLGVSSFLERRAVRAADSVVMNTQLAQQAMRGRYPDLSERILCVMNGCDDDPLPEISAARTFIAAYVGTIYIDRDPTAFFRAAGQVVNDLALSPEDFSIEFMGEVSEFEGVPTSEIAARAGLSGHFSIHPPRTRRQARELLARAALLINLPQDSRTAIPSKIFEYLRYPAYLLALEPAGSATFSLLQETSATVVEPTDEVAIRDALRAQILEFQRCGRPRPIAEEHDFSRRTQAAFFFDSFHRLVASRAL